MDIEPLIENNEPESRGLEYKHHKVDHKSLVKELVAMANSGGGRVIVGVEESDDEIVDIHDVPDVATLKEGIDNVIASYVEPPLSIDKTAVKYDGKSLVVLTVDGGPRLNSFEWNERHVFPFRAGTRIAYMHAYQVADFYERDYRPGGKQSDELEVTVGTTEESDLEGSGSNWLPDENEYGSNLYFTRVPSGHIADVCLFADVYYPSTPVRIETGINGFPMDELDRILRTLGTHFELSNRDGSFTIHQQNAAWFGNGFNHFCEQLQSIDDRYENVPDGFEVDPYKAEAAVYAGNLSGPHLEGLVAIYAAPWVANDGCRYFGVSFVLDGYPIDNSDFLSFSNDTGLILQKAKEFGISSEQVASPEQIPVSTIERNVVGDNVTGLKLSNPLFERTSSYVRVFNTEEGKHLTRYEHIYGHLPQYHWPDDRPEYRTQVFKMTNFKSILPGAPFDINNFSVQIDWL